MLSKSNILRQLQARSWVARNGTRLSSQQPMMSTTTTKVGNVSIFNPTEEHRSLREMLRDFVEKEVDPQALEFNRNEKFNVDLFRKLGDLGILGITADTEFGGSGMDAVAACIAHGNESSIQSLLIIV